MVKEIGAVGLAGFALMQEGERRGGQFKWQEKGGQWLGEGKKWPVGETGGSPGNWGRRSTGKGQEKAGTVATQPLLCHICITTSQAGCLTSLLEQMAWPRLREVG